ncbi:MAG: acetoin utilization protein, partial [Gemmatimonadetes bacterium]
MPTAVTWNSTCRHHYGGAGHPERPQRFEAVLEALRRPELAALISWVAAQPAERSAIERVHPPEYVSMLEKLAERGGGALDADTFLGPRSWESVLAAAGVALSA